MINYHFFQRIVISCFTGRNRRCSVYFFQYLYHFLWCLELTILSKKYHLGRFYNSFLLITNSDLFPGIRLHSSQDSPVLFLVLPYMIHDIYIQFIKNKSTGCMYSEQKYLTSHFNIFMQVLSQIWKTTNICKIDFRVIFF